MTFTVLRLLDASHVEVTIFFPSGKRRANHQLSELSPEIQDLLKRSFALITNGYGARQPITKEQYLGILERKKK